MATVAGTLVVAMVAVVLGTVLPGLPDRNASHAAPVVAPTAAPSQSASGATGPASPGPTSPAPTAPGASPTGPASGAPTTPVPPPANAVPRSGPGTFVRATAALPNKAPTGRVIRYTVQVENGVPVDPNEAAAIIHGVLNDKRSWGGGGQYTWIYVPSGPVDLTASIATPGTTDRICAPLNTNGQVSCRNGVRIALNADRWVYGVTYYGDDVVGYRQYLVNHEFGHYLGHGHVGCPGPGKKAPVMMTQSLGLGQCLKNPWPAEDP